MERLSVMDEEGMRRLLRAEVQDRGVGLRGLAREWEVSPSVICESLSGSKPFSVTLADKMGYGEAPRRWIKKSVSGG